MRNDRRSVPPGWRHNPSAWLRRLIGLCLALLGVGVAGYLSLFQWGVLSNVWEPFFGDGSRRILLESSIARMLPVPDAFLGALAYAAEVVLDLIGGEDRWRSRPWAACCFGALAGLMGLASILLVIMQPVLFHAWCTLCLTSAVISLLIAGSGVQELVASLQHLKREHARGESIWRAFRGFLPSVSAP